MSFPVSFPAEKPLVTVEHRKADAGSTYVLQMHHGKDNRFTWQFITEALFPALDLVQSSAAKIDHNKAVLITIGTGDPKFYSNGLDLENAMETPDFFEEGYLKLLKRFLTFPIPTIAAINGHAYAGGFLLAAAHDYRIQRADRGFLCMNEIVFGANLLPGMSSVLRMKVPSVITYRNIILEGRKYGGKEALEAGLVDAIVDGDQDKVLGKAIEYAHQSKLYEMGASGVYADLKIEMNIDILEAIDHGRERPSWEKARL